MYVQSSNIFLLKLIGRTGQGGGGEYKPPANATGTTTAGKTVYRNGGGGGAAFLTCRAAGESAGHSDSDLNARTDGRLTAARYPGRHAVGIARW